MKEKIFNNIYKRRCAPGSTSREYFSDLCRHLLQNLEMADHLNMFYYFIIYRALQSNGQISRT